MKTNITTKISTIIITAAALAIAGCGKSGSSGASSSSGSSGQSALSVKYKTADGEIYIFTRSADRNKMRIDNIYSEGSHHVYITDSNGGSNKKGVAYEYSDGKWEEHLRTEGNEINMKAVRVEQSVNNAFAGTVSDLTKYYLSEKVGFTKQPGQTVAGKSCDVYAGTPPKSSILPEYDLLRKDGALQEIAIWNGIPLRLKYTETKKDGSKVEKVTLEAQAITTSVPDSAFTKTLETPWLK